MGGCNSRNNTGKKYNNEEQSVVFDKPMHQGSIRDILYYSNQLVSCSDDKSIRSFSLKDLINGHINPIHVCEGHTKGVNRVSVVLFDNTCHIE